jgi:NADH-quinone oxidoreductase subunit G
MTDTAPPETAVTITVNGHDIAAQPGQLVIDACQESGTYIPRFCYHERMKPVGMCRMCLVEIDTGRGPALQPSCMITVTPGMKVDTESAATTKAQDGVLEFLLLNHPLDCPVCDKGGECPLQDQTVAYGPGESRFVEEKRHFEKPIPINDNVYLDRERCILCDRCTRFASDVAGDPLIHFVDRGNQTQVATFPDHPFASYFSGNVVQICPVGALTAKPYRFKARPWDLEEVASTYPNPMGDRITVQSSRNQVLRFLGLDSDAVNWGWLADRERFSFEAFQSPARLGVPQLNQGGGLEPTTWNAAMDAAAAALRTAMEHHGPGSVAVLGGARLLNEDQYAWAKLAKGVIGTDNVDADLGDTLAPHVLLGLPRATIAQACRPGGTVILLGVDPKEELGTLYLRLRHAVREEKVALIEFTPAATGLSSLAAARLHARPGEAGAVAAALVGDGEEAGGVSADQIAAARALLDGRPITVVFGRGSLAEHPGVVTEALGHLSTIPGVGFLPALGRGNLHGALDMGLRPGLLPGRTTLTTGRASFSAAWGDTPQDTGLDARGIFEAAANGRIEVLVLLGADPLTDFPDPALAIRGLVGAKTVIAVDLFATPSVASASIVLPAAAFTERSGSVTTIEGRIQPLRQKVTPPGTARPDWMIAAELAVRLGADLGLEAASDVWTELAPLSAVHGAVTAAAIDEAPDGLLVTATGRVAFEAPGESLPLRPVDGYALRLVVARRMFDNGTIVQMSPSLARLAGPAALRLNEYDFNRLGVAGGTLVRVSSSVGSLEVPAVAHTGVPRGVAVIDLNRSGADPRQLIDPAASSVDVRIETVS